MWGIHIPVINLADLTNIGNINPRALAEPSLNSWLTNILPAMGDIVIFYQINQPEYLDPTEEIQIGQITLEDLGLSPIDLLYLLDNESEKNLTALDDLILHEIRRDNINLPRIDQQIQILYTKAADISNLSSSEITVFETAALIRSLRSLMLTSRPLKPSDLMLQNEALTVADLSCTIDINRIKKTVERLQNFVFENNNFSQIKILSNHYLPDFRALVARFNNIESNEDSAESILTDLYTQLMDVDHFVDAFGSLMIQLTQFSLPDTGFGFVYDRMQIIFFANSSFSQ